MLSNIWENIFCSKHVRPQIPIHLVGRSKVLWMIPTHQRLTKNQWLTFLLGEKIKVQTMFRLAKFRPVNRNHIILQLPCLNQPLRPWNAPIVLGWKPTATALACGNTVREAQKGSEKSQFQLWSWCTWGKWRLETSLIEFWIRANYSDQNAEVTNKNDSLVRESPLTWARLLGQGARLLI